MSRKIPDVVLERYRLNELPDTSTRAIEERLATDTELQQRLEALNRSDEEIRLQYPPPIVVRSTPAPSRHTVPRLLVATAATLALIAIIAALPRKPATNPDEERVKGGRPALAVYRRTANGSERLADGDVARQGDLLRVGYTAAGRPYGLILSIDGRGAVTMHLPPSGDRAAALQSGSTILLDAAYELDDAPRTERFYFVTGSDAFPVTPIITAAKGTATGSGVPPKALALPRGLEQTTFSIQKEGRQ